MSGGGLWWFQGAPIMIIDLRTELRRRLDKFELKSFISRRFFLSLCIDGDRLRADDCTFSCLSACSAAARTSVLDMHRPTGMGGGRERSLTSPSQAVRCNKPAGYGLPGC